MTKYLKRREIELRLMLMGIRITWSKECQVDDPSKLVEEVDVWGAAIVAAKLA